MASSEHIHGTEDESYFVSMTDLMVGMLFVFIIMLMAFALNLKNQQQSYEQTNKALTLANATRTAILQEVQRQLQDRGVSVIIDVENGVLRLPEKLLFARGEFQLQQAGRDAIHQLAGVLDSLLPCYAVGPAAPSQACPQSQGGRLEAVFIEGHTDDRQFAGRMSSGIVDNWGLSTARAIETYRALTEAQANLGDLKNDSEQRLLGVSGYAEFRPARRDDTEEARAENRRIDLRFLMATPNLEELRRIQERMDSGQRP
jgi:chemotaxis protein MotB